MLVGVGQQVQDVGGAVLQSQFGVLAEAHHLREEAACRVRDQDAVETRDVGCKGEKLRVGEGGGDAVQVVKRKRNTNTLRRKGSN